MSVRTAVTKGDMGELAALLVRIGTEPGHEWEGGPAALLQRVRDRSPEQRRELVGAWSEAYRRLAEGDPARAVILTLVHTADPAGGALAAERGERILALSRQHAHHDLAELTVLAEAESAAGRTPPGAFIAVLRRSAPRTPPAGLAAVLERYGDPVLNPGEAWADLALADAARLGPPGRLLLTRLRSAPAKPTRTWERAAGDLIAELGRETVRAAALRWLALAGSPRTLPLAECPDWYPPLTNEQYDPFNTGALCGLARLTALLPPGPDTAQALGDLVGTALRRLPGTGARAPRVATAGVTALARMEGEAATAELARLAARVTHKATARLLGTALAARGPSTAP
ncbi:hypothetical protein [Streptomyces sp. CAU 1734]|uniref:hypothetical protein n=1 Tax=Streptomyces sp. CAU 1734 TaxID=3140360 RepID=UPI003261342A